MIKMVIQELYNLDKFGIQRAKINSNFTELKDALDSFTDSETVSKTFYIKATGSDTTGDGSIGNPYKTISKVKSMLKKIIRTDITIVYQGTNVVEANWLDFSDFTVYTDNYSNYIWVTGELEKVEDVTLTKDGDWKYSDSSKNWIPNEHKGRFLSDTHDFMNFPQLVPIVDNTATQITAENWSSTMNNVNQIVKPITKISIDGGEKLLLNPMCESFESIPLYITYLDIDSGSATMDATDSKSGVYALGNIFTNSSNVQSLWFDNLNFFANNIFYVKSRIFQSSSSGNKTVFYGNMFHHLKPKDLSENTDDWFNNRHLMDIGGGRIITYFNSFQYFFSCITAGYSNDNSMIFEYLDTTYFKNCATIFEGSQKFYLQGKINLNWYTENVTNFFWGKKLGQTIKIDFKNVTLHGLLRENYLTKGSCSWVFDYDAGDGNVTHNISYSTDTFNESTKYIDVAKDFNILLPGIYPEFSSPEKVNILNNTNTDLIIGNELNRNLLFKARIVTSSSDFCNIKIDSINSDDTSSSLQSNALLESNETGSNINANIGGTTGLIFTYSKVSDEFIINIDNKTGLDLDLTWEMERSRK